MQIIKEDIKLNKYKQVYLLYGSEDYLKNLYKTKLINGILGDSDRMNYTAFTGKGIDISKVIEISETLPFFNERRIIIIEESNLFKSQSDFADYIKKIPKSTHIVFVESEVDKRNRLYKAVKENGTVALFDGMDEENLKVFVGSILKQNGKKITNNNIIYLLSKVGTDMQNITMELEKLICYALEREVITQEDIDSVCVTRVENQIFRMIDAIATKKQNMALSLYYDLLSLKEKSISILFLITRHFNILMQVDSLTDKKVGNSEIAKKVGIPPFAVSKYISQAKNFKSGILYQAIKDCVDAEESIKTGRMTDQMAVELLIVKYSSK